MINSSTSTKEINNGDVRLLINFDVNFNDTGIASGVRKYTVIATVARPILIELDCEVITAFDGTSPVLTAGTTSAANQLLDSTAITEGTPGFYPTVNGGLTAECGKLRVSADTEIWVKFTATTPTTGKAKFYLNLTPLSQGA
jgi:hypothetical protein